VSTADEIRMSLKHALHTCDWLQAIASAREILELEPDALCERHLLAQLYLRVSGSRLASMQFRKVLHQAVRRRELWKAVAAQKSLDALAGGEGPPRAYAQIFEQVLNFEGTRGTGSRAIPPVLEGMPPEVFDRICLGMRLTSLIQNERWPVPTGGPSLLVAAWGKVWLEREEESIEAAEGEILFLAPPADAQAVELVAMEETTLLHLAPEVLSGFTAEVPALGTLAAPAERPACAERPEAPVSVAAPPPAEAEAPLEGDDVLFAGRLVVHLEGTQGNVTLTGVVNGLSENGACFECDNALLSVDPSTLGGVPVALQVTLRTSGQTYRWIGRLDWVHPGSAGSTQGFRCGVRWDGLSEEDRAAVSSLRGVPGSETHRLWELWNSSLGADR
jgi:hypothetical protein